MGEKLGKIDELLNKEITPINPEQGVECFLKLVSSNLNKNVIVSGRIGPKPPLDLLPEFSLSLKRFTESIRIFYPNIEIVTETRLTLNEDVYLNDHCYKGEFVFPVAVGIEAIIQTAQALVGKNEIPHISELKLNRPIIIDNEGTILRIIALKEKEKIKVVLRSSQNNFQLDHFSCYVIFEKTQKQIERETYVGDSFYLDEYFYGQLFFQTGVFSCIESYLELEAYKCIGVLGLKGNKNYFSEYLPKNMTAGDPGIRDSAIHCLQACLPNKIVLPLKVESWTRFNAENTEKYFVYGRQLWEKQDEYCFDLEVFNSNYEIVEIWRGLVLKELEEKKWDSLNLSLLNPYINRKSKKDLKELDFNIFITDKSDKNLMTKKCFGKETKYEYRVDGKPIVEKGFISFSDCGVLNLIVGSESLKVSCDIEEVANESRSWRSLLGRNYDLAEFIAKEANEDMLWTCTRVWSCLECVKKVGLVGEELVFEEQIGKSLIFSSFNFLIHSTIIEIKNIGLYCITILIEKK
jgi:enediyne polyketide synthase